MLTSATRLSGMTESVIREMTRVAMQHEAINMAQGFPDYDPPPEMVQAAAAALTQGGNQYSITWGIQPLREAVSARYRHLYDLHYDPDTEITITCGVTEAIIAAILGVVDAGDQVIVIEPAHENYLPALLFAGAKPLWVSLPPPHFEPDGSRLRAAFEQRPKAILINTPHNPGGRVFSLETLRLIADLCIEYNVIAITDEIYEHILYDGRTHHPPAALPGMLERTITTGGLSKTYAATGWRIGWICAPPALSNAARTVKDYLTICAPTPLQHGAIAALNLPDSYYTDLIAAYTRRRDRMMHILDRAGFIATPPEGAYYVLADFTNIRPDLDDLEFALWLAREKKVAVVPGGSFYHAKTPGAKLVRFAFPKQMATFDAVEARLCEE